MAHGNPLQELLTDVQLLFKYKFNPKEYSEMEYARTLINKTKVKCRW